MIKYIVTGAARSGTGYVAQVLKSAGMPCGHEAIFSHGGLDSAKLAVLQHPALLVDSSWLAAPFLVDEWLEGVTVIQVVRDPRKAVESILRVKAFIEDNPYSRFAYRHVPEMRDWRRPEEQAAAYYLAWNRMVEPWAAARHRVEDDPQGLLDLFAIENEGPLFDDTSYNHRAEYPPIELDWLSLAVRLRREIGDMSERYGYL